MDTLEDYEISSRRIIFDHSKKRIKDHASDLEVSEIHDAFVTSDYFVIDDCGVYADSINERISDVNWRLRRGRVEPLISQTESEPYLNQDVIIFKKPTSKWSVLRGPCFVFDYSWGGNYQHWLLVSVERLFVFISLKESMPELKLLVDEDLPAYKKEMFEVLGIRDVDLASVGKGVKCETVYLPPFSNKSGDNITKKSLLKFQALKSKKDIVARRRVYVARNDNGKRPMKNREKLDELLSLFGYEKVFLEDMTLVEKIELFSTAEIIVADFSAGLSHMVFSSINQKFVLLEHDYFKFSGFYSRLAEELGVVFQKVDAKLPFLDWLKIQLKKFLPCLQVKDDWLNSRKWSCDLIELKEVLRSLNKGSCL
jgi:hypothetical protein